MSDDDRSDYVVGVALPNLKERPASLVEECEHFTRSQAEALPLVSLPVQFNHDDNHTSIVGSIVASSVRALDQRVLMRIEPDRGLEAKYASNAVANGVYPALSLSHRFDPSQGVRADGSVVKIPFEISLVEEPWRPGAVIEHVFPSRHSLRRFNDSTLAAFHRRFFVNDIERPPAKHTANGVSNTAHNQYIERLFALVHQRRQHVCQLYSLEAPSFVTHSPPMSTPSTAVDVRASATAAPDAAVAAAQPPVAAENTSPAPPAAAPPPSVADVKDLNSLETLVETEERLAAAQRTIADLQRYKDEIDNQERLKKEAEIAKAKTAVEAFLQTVEQMDTAEAAGIHRRALEAQLQSNPAAVAEHVEALKRTMIRGSKTNEDLNREKAELQAKLAAAEQERHLRQLMDRRRAAHDTYNAYSSPVTLTPTAETTIVGSLAQSMSSRFVDPSPPPPLQQHQQSSTTPNAPAAVVAPVVTDDMLRPFGDEVSTFVENSPVVEIRASVDANKKRKRGWAREAFENAQRAILDANRQELPTYADTGVGITFIPTGEVRASADGKHQAVIRSQQTFNTPQPFGMAEYAPDFFDACMLRLRGRNGTVLKGEDVKMV